MCDQSRDDGGGDTGGEMARLTATGRVRGTNAGCELDRDSGMALG
jgi:hypothetical protein